MNILRSTINFFISWKDRSQSKRVNKINLNLQERIKSNPQVSHFEINSNNGRFSTFTIGDTKWSLGYHLYSNSLSPQFILEMNQNESYTWFRWNKEDIFERGFTHKVLDTLILN
jgi:hypothetical protein